MQCFQEEKHRDQGKKSEDRQIGALAEDPVEQLHQPDEAFFIGHVASLIDQLELQRGRTGVDNQNFHLLVSSRYVFVHPREGRILQIPRIII